jgi:iron complex outermembrane receptor protein
LRVRLNLTASRDRSDSLAGQTDLIKPTDPTRPPPGLLTSPLAPRTPRAADWTPSLSNRANDKFHQGALRVEYDLSDDITLTSVTNYANQKIDHGIDIDSMAILDIHLRQVGEIDSFNQELRLSGNTPSVNWVLGVNYDYAKIDDNLNYDINHSTNQPVPTVEPFKAISAYTRQRVNTYAAFANIDYNLTDQLIAHAGVRFTQANRNAASCLFGPEATDPLGRAFNALQQILLDVGVKTTPFVAIPPNGCVAFSPAPEVLPAGVIEQSLKEDSLSWRAGLDYKTAGDTLLYANVSRGYKSGVISPVAGAGTPSYLPVGQERLDAYEVGVKAPLFDRAAQFNAAAFYYDYTDKQLRTRILDPVFGLLEQLNNVPKSRVLGVEAQLIAQPFDGFDLNLSGTYLDTKVTDSYETFNAAGEFGDFQGSNIPYTPKLSVVADAQYETPISSSINAVIGGTVTYNSSSQATFQTGALPGAAYDLQAYTLYDVRLGIAAADESWRLQLFGRNITNKYYVTNVTEGTDERYRYAGRPATYGVTLSVRTR